jgi:very-short-patch-repair endonuclease
MPEATARTRTVVDESGIVVAFQRERSAKERLERMLWDRINEAGLPMPETQYHWARPERMFRSDFAYVEERILIEVQGGIWAANPGRHNRGSGYQDDARRTNLAMQLGWRLLAFTEAMIRSGEAVQTIRQALTPASRSEDQLALPTYNDALQKTSPSTAANGLGRGIKEA